ncbi:cytochrome P460 family protein [Pseudodonghicola flavimaris]|uniref:Cytochrome P460 family protein n=1 Tax=Pseudodonghicola flavimaris TaxID=3050036 RepID=A0ABT7F1A1_9RHOB|nr:cytochrome P460 family protein [Pseudodonghicola flavimaris]MDK3018378.1 cytochrome P460 family protein [Pseudodonghicola flavimaris]
MRLSTALLPGLLVLASPLLAQMINADVTIPEGYRDGDHYTTVTRGGITEEIYTSAEAIAAARAGQPFPEGTRITMDDLRDGALYRILVMEKRADWSDLSVAGSWQFREFAPDGSPDLRQDGSRCQACHASQQQSDYVFTRDRMID